MKKIRTYLVSLTLVVVAGLAVLATATHIEPERKAGNPTCSDFEPDGTNWTEFKIEPVENGSYDDGTLNVTLTVHDGGLEDDEDRFVDWIANINVSAVLVKGGPNANLYEYDPGEMMDTGLHAPINPNNDKPFGLSHISFCYEAPEEPPEEPSDPVCPADFKGTANGDGSITLSWTPDKGSEGFQVMRKAGDGNFSQVADLEGNATGYHDTDTEVGTVYTYVLVLEQGEQSIRCGQVEVTSIPVFPTALASIAAVAASVLGYVFVRRR